MQGNFRKKSEQIDLAMQNKRKTEINHVKPSSAEAYKPSSSIHSPISCFMFQEGEGARATGRNGIIAGGMSSEE